MLIKQGLLYVVAAIAIVLLTTIGVQYVQIKSLTDDLADANEAKTIGAVNVLRLTAEIESLSADIAGYETDVKALDKKRAQAQAEVSEQRKEYETRIAEIKADLATTPEQVRLKLIRNATR